MWHDRRFLYSTTNSVRSGVSHPVLTSKLVGSGVHCQSRGLSCSCSLKAQRGTSRNFPPNSNGPSPSQILVEGSCNARATSSFVISEPSPPVTLLGNDDRSTGDTNPTNRDVAHSPAFGETQ